MNQKHTIHNYAIRNGRETWRFRLERGKEPRIILAYALQGGDYRMPLYEVEVPIPRQWAPAIIAHIQRGQQELAEPPITAA